MNHCANRRNFYIPILMAVITLAFFSACQHFDSGEDFSRLKDSRLRSVAGPHFTLGQYAREKVIILAGVALWDTACIEQLKILKNLDEKFGKYGVRIIVFVMGNCEDRDVAEFKIRESFNLPMVITAQSDFSETLGREEIVPFIKILNENYRVEKEFTGFTSENELEEIINRRLSEK